MTRIPATIAWAGGLAAMCSLLVTAWIWRWADRPPQVASAAIGPRSAAEDRWPKGLAEHVAAADVGGRSRATGTPASGPESPEADPGEGLSLLPIPQPDVAWEPPLVAVRDRGDGRLEVDAECRPIQVAETSRLKGRRNAAGDHGDSPAERAAGGQPTLAPPPPAETDSGRRVIRVVVEAEQAAWTPDAHQP